MSHNRVRDDSTDGNRAQQVTQVHETHRRNVAAASALGMNVAAFDVPEKVAAATALSAPDASGTVATVASVVGPSTAEER